MSNYTKATNFATKDTLPTGNAGKIVKGTEIDDEFNAIASAISSKADTASPTFTGTPAAPTAASGSNTTQLATTAYVKGELDAKNLGTMSTQNKGSVDITGGTIVGITDLAVADGGTGASSITANSVVLGNGSSALSGNLVAPSTSGNVLTSNGTTWTSAALSAIGVGQTWQSVTRAAGTAYTNSTGKPIMLVRSSVNSESANTGSSISIDGSASIIFSRSGSGFGPGSASGSIIIPNGATYVITDLNPGTIATFELR